MRKGVILIVEDEAALSEALVEVCRRMNREALACRTGRQAERAAQRGPLALAILDIGLPDGSGLDLLDRLRAQQPGLPVLVITAHGNLENAIAARKRGAHSYLVKPFGLDDFSREVHALLQAETAPSPIGPSKPASGLLVGASRVMQKVFIDIAHACASEGHVLITGETGTGKTEAARIIHSQSARGGGPLIELHCHALPESLLESELFGHERGAFTGAVSAASGHVERAEGGTLFLDEIGELPGPVQTKLLRLAEDRLYMRVGGREDRRVNLRLIAATHMDLDAATREKKFRSDLYYRLRVLQVHLPSLRERKEDIPLLCDYLLAKSASTRKLALSDAALRRMTAYDWPGNVRELRNALDHAASRATGRAIAPEHLPPEVRFSGMKDDQVDAKLDEALRRWLKARLAEGGHYGALHDDLEQRLIGRLLEIFNDKPSIMARDLRMNRATLLARRRRYGMV